MNKSKTKQNFRGFKVFFDILKIEGLNDTEKLLLSNIYSIIQQKKPFKFSDEYLASIFKKIPEYINKCFKSLEDGGWIERNTGKPYRKKNITLLHGKKVIVNKWKIDREITLTEKFYDWIKGEKGEEEFVISSSILKTSYSPMQKMVLAWLVSLHQSRNRPKDKRYNTRRGAIDNSPPYDYEETMRKFGLSYSGVKKIISILRHKHNDSGKSVENCRNGILLHRRYGSHGNKLISNMNKRYFYNFERVAKPNKEKVVLEKIPKQEKQASGSFDRFEGETIQNVSKFTIHDGKQYNEKGEQIGKHGLVFDDWLKTI